MAIHDLSRWQHAHDFAPDRHDSERRTRWVIAITLVMMAAEIAAGLAWNSMALLADGWHMGTHAAAIGVTAISYALTRRWRRDVRFSLGPWKVEVLGAYTSALLLGVVAIGITVESAVRLWDPQPVAYGESLAVAVIGLIVNLACARLLHGGDVHGHVHPGHGHGHGHGHHDHGHAHVHAAHDHPGPEPHGHDGAAHGPAASARPDASADDLNLRAAQVHVLADAATSVLAIAALLAGQWAGWWALDPLVGLVGAAMIGWWARGLLADSARVLLDREMDHPLAARARERLQSDGDTEVADLHLWRVGGEQFALQATVVADVPAGPDDYKARLADLDDLAHVMIEVHRCPGCPRAGCAEETPDPARDGRVTTTGG